MTAPALDLATPCVLWEGRVDKDGYPQAKIGGKTVRLLRYVYQDKFGLLPRSLVLDHECHNNDPDCAGGICIHRRCMNLQHVEPVTVGINTLRGKSVFATNAQKTHCIRGHAFDVDNTNFSSKGVRSCATCQRAKDHRRRPSKNPRVSTFRRIGNEVCYRGHSLADAYVAPKTGSRNCRECARLRRAVA